MVPPPTPTLTPPMNFKRFGANLRLGTGDSGVNCRTIFNIIGLLIKGLSGFRYITIIIII